MHLTHTDTDGALAHSATAGDIAALLRERGWRYSPRLHVWYESAPVLRRSYGG